MFKNHVVKALVGFSGSLSSVARWCNGWGVGHAINYVRVRLAGVPLSCNDSGPVVHTHVSLLPFTKQLICCPTKGGDAARLGC